jgi:hypothetical protein
MKLYNVNIKLKRERIGLMYPVLHYAVMAEDLQSARRLIAAKHFADFRRILEIQAIEQGEHYLLRFTSKAHTARPFDPINNEADGT